MTTIPYHMSTIPYHMTTIPLHMTTIPYHMTAKIPYILTQICNSLYLNASPQYLIPSRKSAIPYTLFHDLNTLNYRMAAIPHCLTKIRYGLTTKNFIQVSLNRSLYHII